MGTNSFHFDGTNSAATQHFTGAPKYNHFLNVSHRAMNLLNEIPVEDAESMFAMSSV